MRERELLKLAQERAIAASADAENLSPLLTRVELGYTIKWNCKALTFRLTICWSFLKQRIVCVFAWENRHKVKPPGSVLASTSPHQCPQFTPRWNSVGLRQYRREPASASVSPKPSEMRAFSPSLLQVSEQKRLVQKSTWYTCVWATMDFVGRGHAANLSGSQQKRRCRGWRVSSWGSKPFSSAWAWLRGQMVLLCQEAYSHLVSSEALETSNGRLQPAHHSGPSENRCTQLWLHSWSTASSWSVCDHLAPSSLGPLKNLCCCYGLGPVLSPGYRGCYLHSNSSPVSGCWTSFCWNTKNIEMVRLQHNAAASARFRCPTQENMQSECQWHPSPCSSFQLWK